MIRILNIEPDNYSESARAILKTIGSVTESHLTRTEVMEQIGSYEVLIVRLAHQIDRKLLEPAHRLKAIVSATTGLDHIDRDYAAQKQIAVLSLRGETRFLESITATPEHTWALLLALLRHIPRASQHVQAGAWNRDLLRGHELDGKRLGILGFGRVGRRVARYALAFNMLVNTYDPYVTDWPADIIPHDRLEVLLEQTDILSVHLPLNDETRHMVNAAVLGKLPHGAYLVNTARGEVIDESALLAALRDGYLAGAALDVIAHERDDTLRQHSALLAYARSHDNLLVTPHIAGATYESMMKTEVFMANKLKTHLQQQGLIT